MQRNIKRLYAQQKVMGATLLTLSLLILFVAFNGVTSADHDCTAALLTLPLGLYLLFTKKIILL